MTQPLEQGSVVWAWLDPTVGREQSGRRPVLVVSSRSYNDVVDTLLVVVPLSTTTRSWPNHIRISGLAGLGECYAMTEQPRTISRERVGESIGVVHPSCLAAVKQWLADFLDL